MIVDGRYQALTWLILKGGYSMRVKGSKLFLMLIVCGIFFALIGCSGDTNSKANESETQSETNSPQENVNENEGDIIMGVDPDPVTLTVMVHWDEDMFNHRFRDPIETAYPWITLEHIQVWTGREELEELFADGISPDIIFEISHEDMEYFGLDYDLDELIEKHQYDTSHIDPVYLEAIRAKDPNRRLLGFPYEIINFVLFYNKDIFDLFGEDYPPLDLTWEEAIDLAARLTGERDGIHYRGLDIGAAHTPLAQFSINKTDPETGRVLIDEKEEFARYLDLLNQKASLDRSGEDFFNGGKFVEDRSTAMFVEFVQAVVWWEDAEKEGLNYDVGPLPTWAGEEPVSHRVDQEIIPLSINPYSEHKDAAFRMITHFTETEYQTFASRIGLGPTSIEKDVLDQFFQDYESTHDKNMGALFKNPPASPPEVISRWDEYVDFDVHRYLNDEEYNHLDRNEYLRIVKEESEAKILNAKEAK